MAEESLSPAQIKQMIGMLKAMLPEDATATEEPAAPTSPLVNPNTPIKDAGPSYRSKQHYNKFDDMMEKVYTRLILRCRRNCHSILLFLEYVQQD